MKISKDKVLEIDSFDYTLTDGKYSSEYRGKFVVDEQMLIYVTEDGKSYWYIGGAFNADGVSVTMRDVLDNWIEQGEDVKEDPEKYRRESHSKSLESFSIDGICHLKAKGFSIDEIIRLKKEGIL